MMSVNPDYQVIIVGGGLVGASLAVALGQSDLRVAVVEATAPARDTASDYNERSIALAQGSQQIFAGLDLWPALEPGVCPIHTIHISERGQCGFSRLRREEEGVAALGYVAPARVLSEGLHARLAQLPNVDLLAPAQVNGFDLDGPVAQLELTHAGQAVSLTATMLVAADGAQSAIREQLGIATEQRDYGQTAVIANLTPEFDHQHVAYERFTDTGPMALLPMTEGRCALVWTVVSDQAEAVLQLDDETFLARLQDRFGYRLGYFQQVGQRHAFPLQLVRARESSRRRLALIGNAIHTLHPVAGQGFNLGLRDVAALAEVIVDAQRAGQDFGLPSILQRYTDWRLRDQQRVVNFTDGLVRLFSTSFLPLQLARNTGMLAFDLLPPAKRWFGKLAMGRGGRLPRLARGLPLS